MAQELLHHPPLTGHSSAAEVVLSYLRDEVTVRTRLGAPRYPPRDCTSRMPVVRGQRAGEDRAAEADQGCSHAADTPGSFLRGRWGHDSVHT
jgi:hypothetical protein